MGNHTVCNNNVSCNIAKTPQVFQEPVLGIDVEWRSKQRGEDGSSGVRYNLLY